MSRESPRPSYVAEMLPIKLRNMRLTSEVDLAIAE
jgi:hypothetical protein